jgi:putative transposase
VKRPSVEVFCERVGMKRQNFYKSRRRREKQDIDADFVACCVRDVRFGHPRMGGRKLRGRIADDLEAAGIQIGRDRLFDVLREKGLLVVPKPKSTRTTNSLHCLPVFKNEFKDLVITAPHQAWVADITYIRVGNSFMYLSLLTDAYSRKIVGWHADDTLESVGCLKALEKALKELPAGAAPLHHSDRGCQYCCHAYVNALQCAGMKISMTEQNHCYENAMAERINGILKQEYNLDARFANKKHALNAIAQAIWLYNNERPHLALDFKTPAEVHARAA